MQVGASLAIQHLDPVGAGVGDVHPSAARRRISVIEPWLGARRDRDEARAD